MKKTNERLLFAVQHDAETIFREYSTDYSGYNEESAEQMRELYGRNEITHKKAIRL